VSIRQREQGKTVWLAVALGLVCTVFVGAGSQGQTAPAAEDQPTPLINSVKGPDLFRAYCASCHGVDGKGHGPAALALKATVADLTTIARNNNGEFPVARVQRIIMGEGMIASHGSREMPVWGPIFHQIEADVDRGNVRLDNLVKYLQSIQSIPSAREQGDNKSSTANLSTGTKLYRQLCAGCHGNDLKGNGPAPYPFKDVPPDLTTLGRRHGGNFPDAYFAEVLRNGVPLPSHGPAEMPIWGTDFKMANGLSSAQITQRIADLASYIKSQQAK
jgi:mono/diheme cytochrome c family protein